MNLSRKQRQILLRASSCKSICSCGTGHFPEATWIELTPVEDRIHTRNVLSCKSTRCVNCSGYIAKNRAVDISRMLSLAEESGLKGFVLTLTTHSGPNTALNTSDVKKQIGAFQKIWRHAQNSRFFLPEIYVAAVEYTVGKQWNAHLHVHVLAFYEEGSKWTPERSIKRWLTSAEKKGFSAVSSAQDYRPVDSGEKGKLARYLVKGPGVASVALEMQGERFKGNRTLFGLLKVSEPGSYEERAYVAAMRAFSEAKLRTYRPSDGFSRALKEAKLPDVESCFEEEKPLDIEPEKILVVPVFVWKELNRVPLSESFVDVYSGCFLVRDVVEDLLISGDRILALSVVEEMAKIHHFRLSLSKSDYHQLVWKKLIELLL